MASVTHKPASLCTMFRSLITPDCWVFGHHPTDPLVVMGRITLVYNYRVIFEFSIQFFSPRFLHLPMIIVVLLVIFWMCVPDEFFVEDNRQVFVSLPIGIFKSTSFTLSILYLTIDSYLPHLFFAEVHSGYFLD